MFKLKKLIVEKVGDTNGRDLLACLETEWDGERIIKSMRYSDEDIASEGVEKVRQWIKEDHQRIRAYDNGEFFVIGIRAVATVLHTYDDTNAGSLHEISTAGLWGIETDSDEDYFTDVGQEELADLKGIIADMGIGAEEFDALTVEWPSAIEW